MVSVFAINKIKWSLQVKLVLYRVSKLDGVKNVSIDIDRGSIIMDYSEPRNLIEVRSYLNNLRNSKGAFSFKKLFISYLKN